MSKLIEAVFETLNLQIQTESKNYECVFKVGIHHGKLTAAITGSIKAQFSFIGDTMNTASRHCGNCKEGSILLSEAVYNQVKVFKKYIFTEHQFEAKGKGTLTGYFVESATNNSKIGLDPQQSRRCSTIMRRSSTNEFLKASNNKITRS